MDLTTAPFFSKEWQHFLDEVLPPFVKSRFSPDPRWANKPFSQEDVAFFSKGLIELSDFFTEDRRSAKLPNYFSTPKARSSYLLYFLPIHAAKFITLFQKTPLAMEALIRTGKKNGLIRIADFGAGPGTASIALLFHLFDFFKKEKKIPFKIEFTWVDRNEKVLDDGEALLAKIIEAYPQFNGEISLLTEARDWWNHEQSEAQTDSPFDLSLFGNVLNEGSHDRNHYAKGLPPLLESLGAAGILFLEPAFKSASQRLSQIRNEMMPHPLYGPCLHQQACPLSEGRDWCHMSVKAVLPGTFFKKFSIRLGGVREWLKFSYLWVAPKTAQIPKTHAVRVVSDPIRGPEGLRNQICQPEKVGWINTPRSKIFRGALWTIKPGHIYERSEKPDARKKHHSGLQPKNEKTGSRARVRGVRFKARVR